MAQDDERRMDEENENKLDKDDNDLAARRVNVLKAVMKRLLWTKSEEKITKKDFQGELNDIEDKQVEGSILNYEYIKPLIPSTKERNYISYQIPVIVMANVIFKAYSYDKYIEPLCPKSQHHDLQSLLLDGMNIYPIFCFADGDKVNIFKPDDSPITGTLEATRSKDSIIKGFFDLGKILQICNQHNMEFVYIIKIRPGLKTVMLSGELINTRNANQLLKYKNRSSTTSTTTHQPQATADSANINDRKQEIKQLDKDAKELSLVLHKRRNNCKDVQCYNKEIKDLKSGWENMDAEERDATHTKISDLKTSRQETLEAAYDQQQQLNTLQQQAYIKRQVILISTGEAVFC